MGVEGARASRPPVLGFVACLLLAIVPAVAHAHSRSVAYVDWRLDESGGDVRVRLTPLDDEALLASLAAHPDTSPLDDLEANVRLRRGTALCAPSDGHRLEVGRDRVSYAWRVECPPPAGDYAIESDALFDAVAGHVQLVSIWLPGAAEPIERVLSERARSARLDQTDPSGPFATLASFAREGVAHIVSGWDHLAFLLVLVIGLGRLRDVALAVTGFTAGHSLTLAAVALGAVRAESATVEMLIAASIVVLAVENTWLQRAAPRARSVPIGLVAALIGAGLVAALHSEAALTALLGLALFTACYFGVLSRVGRPSRLRIGIAALFGLVHGFGFAGALAELPLRAGQRVVALAGFNLGVEAGQLALVGVAAAGLYALRGRGRATIAALGSATAAAAGTFWLVVRAFGG